MAIGSSQVSGLDRTARRRRQVVEEALDHAVDVMTEHGVGALTVSEVARRTGMRGPSLYKYFPSLHALYDALFARGLAAEAAAARAAIATAEPGVPRLRAAAEATVRWCVDNPALAQLLFWRPVPGFEPSPDVFAASVDDMREVREEFTASVRLGQLSRAADSDDGMRLYTAVLSGVISQQMANQPGASYEDGLFSGLAAEALDMFFAHYHPEGEPDADPRSG